MRNTRHFLLRWYAPHLGITLLVLAIAAFYSLRAVERLYTQRLITDLETQALLAVKWLGAADGALLPAPQIHDRCLTLGAVTGQRWTILNAEGRVLGDSDGDMTRIARDAHALRPEIRAAFQHGSGWARRRSATVGRNLIYVAKRIDVNDRPLGVIRVAVPLTQIESGLQTARNRLVLAFGGMLALALTLGLWVSRRTAAPVAALGQALHNVARGNLDFRLAEPQGIGAVDTMSGELNSLAQRMQEQIEALAVERAYREAILSSMTEGVLALDLDRRIAWLNEAAAVMLRVRAARLVGSPLHEVVPHAAFLDAVDAAVANPHPVECEATIGSRPQTVLWIHAAALRNGAGARVGTVFVFNDLTHMRHLQRVRQDFVANVSHELKTPVTAIKGVVETLLDGSRHDPDAVSRFLDIVQRQAAHLDRIVDDLLLLSRLEAQGGRLLDREPVPLAPLLCGAVDVCSRRAAERRVTIDVTGADGIVLQAHPSLLEQALINLIDNAVKYGPEDATVTVAVTRDKDEVRIAVRDQGPGIARQHLDRIFERFYRVDRGRSRDLGGTGLGLSIVRHIADAHLGRVEVESEPGSGSTFSLFLPDNRQQTVPGDPNNPASPRKGDKP